VCERAEGGRGLFAAAPIAAGEGLAVVPYSLIITVAKAKRSAVGVAVRALNADALRSAPVSERVLLYLYLIAERADRSGPFGLWLSTVVPQSYCDPIHWPDDAHATALLKGTTLEEAVRNRKRTLRKRFDSLFPVATRLFPAVFPADTFTWYIARTHHTSAHTHAPPHVHAPHICPATQAATRRVSIGLAAKRAVQVRGRMRVASGRV
jgi:hypothetical protein